MLSEFALSNWEAAAENQNRIYERLIDEVWRRGWGEGEGRVRRRGAGENLSRQNFNLLMETIAHAAWLGGDTRSCSHEDFKACVSLHRCEEAWEQFAEDGGDDIANFAMNFYLKASEEAHRGFEFTHKSFGDYLTARALIGFADRAGSMSAERPDIAMQDWFVATSSGKITHEIISFVRDEFRLRGAAYGNLEGSKEIKASFIRLANIAIGEGFPTIGYTDKHFRTLEGRQQNAEAALWMIMSAAAYSIWLSGDAASARVEIDWRGPLDLARLLNRLEAGVDFHQPVLRCLACVAAPGAQLFGARLSNADLTGADLRDANLNCSVLMHVSLKGANLKGAHFLRANLDSADFEGANVEGADFSDAHIGGSNLFSLSKGSFVSTDLSLAIQGRLTAERIYSPKPEEIQRVDFKGTHHIMSNADLIPILANVRKSIIAAQGKNAFGSSHGRLKAERKPKRTTSERRRKT